MNGKNRPPLSRKRQRNNTDYDNRDALKQR